MPSHAQILIFGASGDLSQCKLIPALYALSYATLLAGDVAIVGFPQKEKSHEPFRTELSEAIGRHSRFNPVRTTR